ncbi:RNA guanine-N7 methyltransferase activating subunit [Bufo gargarizans]|uniref:RNA guanine-N7 methyltransferase activating subunit n=1 Tax=Bufo gargarizans TaxID=30331 RepID=UPI001CF0FC08|nr:RNA guanine-N7 methyltransferase activating subunit [Bufo gargarizans]
MTDTSDTKQTYENMFSHRFTAQDAEYQEYLKMPESQPPIVEDWRGGNQRNQDRYRDNRHQRSWEGRRDWSNNSYNQQRGGRGWGSNHNQYRQDRSYHQAGGHHSYHSGNQRFYPDRY